MMKHAIAVIGYQRLDHLAETLRCLSFNYDVQNCPLYIFIDGPTDTSKSSKEYKNYKSICSFANTFAWKGKKYVLASDANRGLRDGVRFAIDTVLSNYTSIIVIEDDIVTSPYFYRYMKKSLSTYNAYENVGAICAHCYPFSRKIFNPEQPYFLQHFACWGWGTWRNIWESIEWDSKKLMLCIEKTSEKINLDMGYGAAVSRHLHAHHFGYINTWAVFVGVSLFEQKKLCMFPPQSLTSNIGWRGDGSTHMSLKHDPNAPIAFYEIEAPPSLHTSLQAEESMLARKAYSNHFYPNKIKSFLGFLKRNAETVSRKLLHRPFKLGKYKQRTEN